MEFEAGAGLEGGGGGGGGDDAWTAWSSGPPGSHGARGGEAEKRRNRRWEVMGRDGWNGRDEVNFAVERAMRGPRVYAQSVWEFASERFCKEKWRHCLGVGDCRCCHSWIRALVRRKIFARQV